jgi:hypothetical protein
MKRACVCLFVLLMFPLLGIASAPDTSKYREVDGQYLFTHMEEYSGQKVRTSGTVYFMVSSYMFEDFWLNRTIPVVVRSAGLPMPSEGSYIEVYGTIEHSDLEGGFYYLKADSYTTDPAPEFPSMLILALFMIASLLAVAICKKENHKR